VCRGGDEVRVQLLREGEERLGHAVVGGMQLSELVEVGLDSRKFCIHLYLYLYL
jgi:hypothetical protein